MLKPLFKYTGGKFSEYNFFSKYIPQNITNYFEPFAGSCSVYLRLKNEKRITGISYINDISTDLINFLREISDNALEKELHNINEAWKTLDTISKTIYSEYGNDFSKIIAQKEIDFNIDPILKKIDELIYNCNAVTQINWGGHDIASFIKDSLKDKLKRFSKKNFIDNTETVADLCVSTAIHQGFYFAVRALYNEWLNDNSCTKYTNAEKATHWFFIREMCYGSMFRFNKKGEFNIPYGGYSYNKKNFDDKISNIINIETINAFNDNVYLSSTDFEDIIKIGKNDDDFMFLDPPYDSTFSEYDKNTFGHAEHERLSKALKDVKCKWLMVIKNTDFIHDLYKDWANITKFNKTYMYQVRGRDYDKNVEHLIITNY